VFGETCRSKSKDALFQEVKMKFTFYNYAVESLSISPREQLAGDMLLPANCSTQHMEANPRRYTIWNKSFVGSEKDLKEIMLNKSGWYKIIICGNSAEKGYFDVSWYVHPT